MSKPPIDVTPQEWRIIEAILKKHVPFREVWAFGSRAKGTAHQGSDLDLVVFADPQHALAVYQLAQAFEESFLPFRVDVLVWGSLTTAMQDNIRAQYIVLQP